LVNKIYLFACGTKVAYDIEQVGFTPSSPVFPDQQLLRMEALLPNTSLPLNALRKNDLHEVGLD